MFPHEIKLLEKIEAEKASLLKEKAGVCPLVSASSKASK